MKSTWPHNRSSSRRGAALIAFVTALLVIGTLVLWLFHVTSGTSSASLSHFISTGALYAAESGMEMGAREIGHGTDFDNEGNGTLGTISNNGNPTDDPALATGAWSVEQVSASPAVYRATGRPVQASAPWTSYRRVVEFRIE